MVLKLTEEQLNLLKHNNTELFPSGSVKIEKRKNKIILIVDFLKMYNTGTCSKEDFINVIEDYESIGWKYYGYIQRYIYFYKNISIIEKIKNIFK